MTDMTPEELFSDPRKPTLVVLEGLDGSQHAVPNPEEWLTHVHRMVRAQIALELDAAGMTDAASFVAKDTRFGGVA
jgi:hypothetical protein